MPNLGEYFLVVKVVSVVEVYIFVVLISVARPDGVTAYI